MNKWLKYVGSIATGFFLLGSLYIGLHPDEVTYYGAAMFACGLATGIVGVFTLAFFVIPNEEDGKG